MSALTSWWNSYPLLPALVAAFAIGSVGSSAYVTALMYGFLGEQMLEQLRSRFETIKGDPPRNHLGLKRISLFVLFGGGIALVFQWAQGVVFAPIQALVLGATWPTVISQFLSRGGQTEGEKIQNLADRIAGKG